MSCTLNPVLKASNGTERPNAGHNGGLELDDGEQPFHEQRQAYTNHHSSLGAVHAHRGSFGVAGHIIHMAGVFIPVVAGELIQDATKYKKAVRLASIGTALAYEGMYVFKEHQRAKEQEAKLAECRGRE
jgi:hypothetical protein